MLRVILLRSEILRLAFQNFIENCIKRCRESGRPIPEIVRVSGHPSDLFSKNCARSLHLIGITDKRLTFGSFGH